MDSKTCLSTRTPSTSRGSGTLCSGVFAAMGARGWPSARSQPWTSPCGDLKAKALGLPLFKLLGPFRDSVPIYGSGGWTNFTVEELVAEATGWVDQGIKRVKIKVGKEFGQSEREDIQRLEAVRRAVGDDVAIYVDANNGYYPKQAIYMAKEFERYQVGWFEEPVLADDIDGLARVADATSIPVATGEHEYTKFGFRELISRGGADIVQPTSVVSAASPSG